MDALRKARLVPVEHWPQHSSARLTWHPSTARVYVLVTNMQVSNIGGSPSLTSCTNEWFTIEPFFSKISSFECELLTFCSYLTMADLCSQVIATTLWRTMAQLAQWYLPSIVQTLVEVIPPRCAEAAGPWMCTSPDEHLSLLSHNSLLLIVRSGQLGLWTFVTSFLWTRCIS